MFVSHNVLFIADICVVNLGGTNNAFVVVSGCLYDKK